VFLGKNRINNEALCAPCASARVKNNKFSPGHKVHKDDSGKNKSNTEVLGDLGAFAREKNN
jgi:hypothetical protein